LPRFSFVAAKASRFASRSAFDSRDDNGPGVARSHRAREGRREKRRGALTYGLGTRGLRHSWVGSSLCLTDFNLASRLGRFRSAVVTPKKEGGTTALPAMLHLPSAAAHFADIDRGVPDDTDK
jgi:hypothetical protein